MRILPPQDLAQPRFFSWASLSAGLSAVLFSSLITPAPAMAYPVDCAILLCLAGGFPASVECAHARAVMIARITPWPIEPPLQIWNCPMRIEYRRPGDGPGSAIPVLHEVSFPLSRPDFVGDEGFASDPLPGVSPDNPGNGAPTLVPVQDRADVDISDPVYDFVRSIRVTNIEYSQRRNRDGDCNSTTYIRLGLYGAQGDYAWRRGALSDVPRVSAFAPRAFCGEYRFRSVVIQWRDHLGQPDFEEVTY